MKSLIIICIVLSIMHISCSDSPEYPPNIKKLLIAVDQSPRDEVLYVELIEELYEKEFYKESLEKSQELLEIAPNSSSGYLYAGLSSEQLEKWDETEDYYKKLCEYFPEESQGFYRLAILYYKKGIYDKSIEYMEKAVAKSISDTVTNMNMMNSLAEAYYYNHDLEKAYYILDKVLELDPFNQDALYSYGVWKLREGKYKKSIQLLEKLISQRPKELYPYMRAGKAYYHSKNMELAEDAFWDASRYDSTVEVLAKIVHVQDFGSIYKDLNTAVVKVIEEYHYKEGDKYYVRGIVENLGLEMAKWVTVVIKFYDKDNNVIKQKSYKVSPKNLRPEQYAFFKIDIPYAEEIYDVKIEPNWHKRSSSIYLK